MISIIKKINDKSSLKFTPILFDSILNPIDSKIYSFDYEL